jgi:hypothetical protein
VLKSGKILGGLAILEDAHHNTAKLDAVPVEIMEQREEQNLALVKSWMGKVPVDLDILIIDEIGKNISGAGMDTKVINRSVNGEYNPWPDTPFVHRIYIRSISEGSYHSAVGIGMADVAHDALVKDIDWNPTIINSLTAGTPGCIRTPIHFPSDEESLRRIAPTVGKTDLSQVTYCRIVNTLELIHVAVSENLVPTLYPNAKVVSAPFSAQFDAAGNLDFALKTEPGDEGDYEDKSEVTMPGVRG